LRYLGLDLGRKRIGLALSDETGLIASPIGVIQVQNQEQVFTEIVRRVAENQVGKLVIGLPIQLNGKEGIEAERARAFAAELQPRLTIPIIFMDERLSSVAAERMLLDAGHNKQKRRANIDATAAALVLQTALDLERRRAAQSTD
jgi:putative Holliday junction resolvase